MIFNFNNKTKLYVTAELDHSDEIISGYLSILSANFDHVPAGYYVSNEAGVPFAYRIKPNTVNVIVTKSEYII